MYIVLTQSVEITKLNVVSQFARSSSDELRTESPTPLQVNILHYCTAWPSIAIGNTLTVCMCLYMYTVNVCVHVHVGCISWLLYQTYSSCRGLQSACWQKLTPPKGAISTLLLPQDTYRSLEENLSLLRPGGRGREQLDRNSKSRVCHLSQ